MCKRLLTSALVGMVATTVFVLIGRNTGSKGSGIRLGAECQVNDETSHGGQSLEVPFAERRIFSIRILGTRQICNCKMVHSLPTSPAAATIGAACPSAVSA